MEFSSIAMITCMIISLVAGGLISLIASFVEMILGVYLIYCILKNRKNDDDEAKKI